MLKAENVDPTLKAEKRPVGRPPKVHGQTSGAGDPSGLTPSLRSIQIHNKSPKPKVIDSSFNQLQQTPARKSNHVLQYQQNTSHTPACTPQCRCHC